MTYRPLRWLVTACLMTPLASCQTPPTPALPSQASAVKAVPCVSLGLLSYHAPTNAADASKWFSGLFPDPTNAYDTPSTVTSVRSQNAAIKAVCGP